MQLLAHGLLAIATLLVAPLALGVALARPSWRAGLRERLFAPRARSDRPIWVHAASVGEVAAAGALIDALVARGLPLHLTATTASGRDRLGARHGDTLAVRLAPLDHPWIVRRALVRLRPRALVLVETEIWPALVAAARGAGVPVVVVSARLSERGWRLRREWAPLFEPGFAALTAVGARTRTDADRFVDLGALDARVRVTGDLKWVKPPAREAAAPELAQWMSGRPTVVVGSTHADEIDAFVAAIDTVRAAPRGVQWLWAPRHPETAPALARRLEAHGLRVALRSRLPQSAPRAEGALQTEDMSPGADALRDEDLLDGVDDLDDAQLADDLLAPLGDTPPAPAVLPRVDVLVLDTLGELPRLWTHGMLAVVGGTFGATGGHDLLEPLHAGRPVLFGPATSSVSEVADAIVLAGAGLRVEDGVALGRAVLRLLDAAAERAERVARGTALIAQARDALDANVALVLEAAASRPSPPASEARALAATGAPSGLYARAGPVRSPVARGGLAAAAAFYACGAALDRASSRFGTRRTRRLPCAVVSVGSWLAGGAAKTPVALWLAGALRARGHRVGVVTRGHGVRLGGRVEIASHGAGPCAPADRVGDEALVIARHAEGVPVLVARDRHRAGLLAVTEFGCDVLLLDDGFQHFALHRDVDLVCLDAAIGLGNGRVLPAGPLRESPRSWARADALVVTGGALGEDDEAKIEAWAPGLRRFGGARGVRRIRGLRTGELLEPDALAGQSVGLLAGLADPAGFRALAEGCGMVVERVELAADHHAWRRHEIARLGRRGAVWVTTEKDAAKIDPEWITGGVALFVLEMAWTPAAVPSLVRFVEHACGLDAGAPTEASSMPQRAGAAP